jgi:hypothetical protein
MRKIGVLAIVATLAISACGSDGGSDGGGDQQRLADELMEAIDAEGAGEFVDEECIRDKANELSDEDATILYENIDAEDLEGLGVSSDGELIVANMLDCFEGVIAED